MKIWALNTLESGIDLIDSINSEIPLSGIIGLSNIKRNDDISGYVQQSAYCNQRNIQLVEVDSYQLNKMEDKDKITNLPIDVLIVAGWQRLVPEWLITHCSKCIIGIHGSMDGISGGRGRSPQNWSLIFGKSFFSLSIFVIDKGIDSGEVIDTRSFCLSAHDDIRSSNHKVSLVSASMIVDAIKSGKLDRSEHFRQQGDFRYLPQRLPEDGYIDWDRTSIEIYDFVRALTSPYPGALTKFKNSEIKILHVKPFELDNLFTGAAPGEIVKIFTTGDFLVKSSDALILVDNYTVSPSTTVLHIGTILESVKFDRQIELIKERHYKKYPDNTLHELFK